MESVVTLLRLSPIDEGTGPENKFVFSALFFDSSSSLLCCSCLIAAMSPRRPSVSDRGKRIAKPRRQARYIIRVPDVAPIWSAPTQTPSPAVVSTPSTSTLQPIAQTTEPTRPTSHSPAAITPHPPLLPTPSTTTPHPLLPTPHSTAATTPHPTVLPTPSTSTPHPSHIGPSPGFVHTPCRPSSSSNPSPDIAIPSDDADAALVDPDPPLHERPMIEPYNRGFFPSRVASHAITRCIKQQFLSPWPSWGAIPPEEREPFWQRFKMKVQWRPEHEAQIKKNFHTRASHRLSEMFREARIAGQRPYWIGDHIWTRLLEHWNSPSYRNKQAAAQRNRASEKGGTLHTGGSITTHEHALRLAKELGREAFIDEVFYQTHLRKGTNQFVDERSRRTHEEFSSRLSQVRSEQGSCPDGEHNDDVQQEDIIRTQCWVDVVGGLNKGRLYRTGELGKGVTAGRGIHKQEPSSSTCTEEAMNRLTQRLEERDQAYEKLSRKFEDFQNLVMAFLPPDAHSRLQQHHSSPTPPQQEPTAVQATPVNPTAVPPTPVPPSAVQPTTVQS